MTSEYLYFEQAEDRDEGYLIYIPVTRLAPKNNITSAGEVPSPVIDITNKTVVEAKEVSRYKGYRGRGIIIKVR